MLRKLGGRTPDARRRVVVLADQAASSLTNVLVAILVARSVSATGFGAFGLAMVVYQLVLGLARALIGEPFIARHAKDPPDVRRGIVPDVVGASLTVGVLGGAVVGGVGLALGDLAGSSLMALAIVLPFLIAHDTLRFEFIVDRPARALAIDSAWLLLVVVATVEAPSAASAAWFVTAWGLSGSAALVLGLVLAPVSTWRVRPVAWFRRTWHDGVRYAGDFLTALASGQAAVLALWGLSGPATLGAVRASQTFYGPLNTVHLGVYLAVVPDGVRLSDRPGRLLRLIVLTSAGLSVLAVCWMIVGLALPEAVGRELLGSSWAGADEIMVPMGVSMVAGGALAGGFLGIRALGDAGASLRSRVLSAPGQLVLPIVGAVVGDAVGFALGAAAGRLLASGIWWTAFRDLLHGRRAVPASDARSVVAEEDAVLATAMSDDG